MRKVRTAVLTGMAALAVAGVGLAAARDTHTLKVDLPDGSVARLEYSDDVAPKVMLAPVSHAVPVALVSEFDRAPFAALDQIAAEMDRQAAAMVHEAAQLEALPMLTQDKLKMVALSKLAPGTMHYELVSTTGASGTCRRSVEITSYGSDEKPRIVSTSSSDCRPLDRTPRPVRLDTPDYSPTPGLAKPRMAEDGNRALIGTTV